MDMDTNTADFLIRVRLRGLLDNSPGASLDRLRGTAVIRQEVAEMERIAVREARAAGASWSEIGDALGVTKQAAQQRHGGIA